MPSRRWLQSRRLPSATRSSRSCTGLKNGGTLDGAAFESGAPGTAAFIFHALNGGVVLLVALALLIVSFFAKIPHGVRWAVIVLVCTIVQIALGTLSRLLAPIGAVHGAVALVLFGVAVMAAMRAQKPAAVEEPVPAASGVTRDADHGR